MIMLRAVFIFCLLTFLCVAVIAQPDPNAIPPGCDSATVPLQNPIVYTSAPRDLRPTGGYFEDFSPLQRFTEVAAITNGFGESDVVITNIDRTKTVVYNCTASPVNCAAQEAAVAPDGKRIAFSVTTGSLVTEGVKILREPTTAKLYIYDIASKVTTEVPSQPGAINRMPDWIDDDTLVFSSNGGGTYPVRMTTQCHRGLDANGRPRGYNQGACASMDFSTVARKSLQIWRMDIDGRNAKNLTPSETQAIRPVVLRHPKNKGRIAFTSHQNQEDRCWYQAAAGPGTCPNRWWIMTMAEDGTSPTVFAGSHHSPTLNKYPAAARAQRQEEFMALRPPMELADGRICFGNYYRGNHMGGKGSVLCASVQLGDFQVEGCAAGTCVKTDVLSTKLARPGSAQYIPSDLHYLANFGTGSDNDQSIDDTGKAMGGMNYVSSMATGQVMATWWDGWCYNQNASTSASPFKGTMASIGGGPLCDMQIVKLLTPQVTNPRDPLQVTVLINDPLLHEFDAHEIVPEPVTHVQPPLDTSKGCFIEVADLRANDLYPISPTFQWNRRASDVGIQANTVKSQDLLFHGQNVKSLAIYGVQNHTTTYPDPKWRAAVNYTGYESVWLIGKQDMMADGSLKMQVPCSQPMFMSALDASGKWITHDPWLHSLQRGETKTCFGCHEGHTVERRLTLGAEPQALFAGKQAAGTNPPLLNGREIVPFAQVGPIVEKACAGCHAGFQNDALLYDRLFHDQCQQDFPWMKQMLNLNGQPCVPRPYFTGLTGRFALQSILIQVMEGKRLDGYTNTDSATDQDYPTGHPVVPVTPAEIKTVVDFIQLGAPR